MPGRTWCLTPFLMLLLVLRPGFALKSRGELESWDTRMIKEESRPQQAMESDSPRFAAPVPNVTVRAGQTAVLTCQVSNLGNYKVAWVRVDTQTILTIHTSIVTRNPRISLSHHDHVTWRLHLERIRREDRGFYMCQLNTDPMMSVQGFVEIVVSPTIIDEQSSDSDVVVREKKDVNLTCRADGFPRPKIRWRRADGAKLSHKGGRVVSVEGGSLYIASASRADIGKYYCIATNGVPPSTSKSVNLLVQFAPMVWVANQQELATVGDNVSLSCSTEAWPKAIHYWMRDSGRPLTSGRRFRVYEESEELNTRSVLVIREVRPDDFGKFVCVAKNSLGTQDGHITLSERRTPPPPPASTTTSTSSSLWTTTSRPRSKVVYKTFVNDLAKYKEPDLTGIHVANNAAHGRFGDRVHVLSYVVVVVQIVLLSRCMLLASQGCNQLS